MTKAVIKTGGKQYLVSEGDVLDIEKIEGEGKIKFDEVLMIDDGKVTTLGTPLIEKAFVDADILEQFKEDKIKVFKMKRRKRYRRSQGHRQRATKVEIIKINA